MDWIDIASIVFVCVTANHLGLIKAMEKVVEQELPIINCPKCGSFWWSLVYTLYVTHNIITSLTISFLCSYLAIWLELFEGFIDTIYLKFYEKIYNSAADASTTDAEYGNPEGPVS